jgi:hypothetical protein
MQSHLMQWRNRLQELACDQAFLARKGGIKYWRYPALIFEPGASLQLSSVFYTDNKATQLRKNYRVEPSIEAALMLWAKKGDKPLSTVSIATHAHHVKAHFHEGANAHASAAGPCIDSVVITRLPNMEVLVDVTMRTSEFIRKLPADIWFIDDLLKPFELGEHQTIFRPAIGQLFANQWGLLIHHFEDPVTALEQIEERDESFWRSIIKTLYYDIFVPSDQKKFVPTRKPGEWLHQHMPVGKLTELTYYVKHQNRRIK